MQPILSALVLGAFAALLPAQLSGSYLIDPAALPPDFTSIQAAATAAVTNGIAGPVVFSIAPGTYTESVTMTQVPGASVTNTLTFRALVPGTVHLIGSTGNTFTLSGITTARTGWIVFDGLMFDNAPGYAISGTTYVEGLEIRHCTFGPQHRPLTGSRHALISSENSGTEVGWHLHHNTFTFPNRLAVTAYGIYLSNGGGWSFHDNVVDLNGCNYGLYMINQNRRLDTVYNNVFTGNLAASTSASANAVAVIKADVSNYDNDFVHNTFVVGLLGTSGCIIATRGLGGTVPATNRIFGNVFVLTGGGTCIVMNASTSLPNPYFGDGNVFWAPAGEIGRTTPSGAGITTLAAWQATTLQDAASFEGDPLFTNGVAVPFDLRLQPGSPAQNRAVNLYAYVSGDLAGRFRDAQPDAGAYESSGFATYGLGCAGTGALVPAMGSVGTVALGSTSFGVELQNALPSSVALLWAGASRVSYGPQPLPFPIGGGCSILAAPDAVFFHFVSGAGTAVQSIGLPASPVWLGTDFNFQWGVLDPGSVSPFGIAVSKGGVMQL